MAVASVPVHVLLLLTVVIWGLAYTAIDQALLEMGPANLTIVRHFIAVAALVAVLAAQRRLRAPRAGDAPRFLLLGFVSTVAYPLALYTGQTVVPPGTAALLVSSMPVWTAVLANAFLSEPLTKLKVSGIGIALAGVTIVIAYGTPGQELTPVAIENAALILLAPLSWAVFTVAGKPLTKRYSGVEIAAYSTTLGTAVLALALPFVAGALWSETVGLSAAGWGWVLFLGLFSSALTTVLWFHALGRAQASQVAVYVYLMPVLAIAWAAAILSAPVTPFVVLGGSLIIGGIALTNSEVHAKRLAARHA